MPDCTCEWTENKKPRECLWEDPNCPLHGTGRAKECTHPRMPMNGPCPDCHYTQPAKECTCPSGPDMKTHLTNCPLRVEQRERIKTLSTPPSQETKDDPLEDAMDGVKFFGTQLSENDLKEIKAIVTEYASTVADTRLDKFAAAIINSAAEEQDTGFLGRVAKHINKAGKKVNYPTRKSS